MPYTQAVLSDPWALSAITLVVAGLMLAVSRRPKSAVARKRTIWLLWAACFGILTTWIMRQQALVLAGGVVSSAERPVAVPIKGTVRYVTHELAYRHDATMWLLLLCGLGFIAAYKLARVADEA